MTCLFSSVRLLVELVEVLLLLLQRELLERLGQLVLLHVFELDLALLDAVEQAVRRRPARSSPGRRPAPRRSRASAPARPRSSCRRRACRLRSPQTRTVFVSSVLILARSGSNGVDDGDDAAVLRDGGEAALGLDGDVLPALGALGVVAALDGVDDDVLLDRLLARLGVLHVVLVVHVRRRVADEEDDLQRLLVVGPLDLVDGVVERLVDVLGGVAAAVGLEGLEVAVDLVEVVAEVEDLGDVLVALVAVGDEADLEVGAWACRRRSGCRWPRSWPWPRRSGRPCCPSCRGRRPPPPSASSPRPCPRRVPAGPARTRPRDPA